MVEKISQSNEVRVAVTGGGIEIRREGRPVESAIPRGGSVYLVIDCSCSMGGGKTAQAKEGAINFAEEALVKRYAVGLISFASAASHLCEPRQDLSQIRRHLPSLGPDGSTDMADGIELATLKLRRAAGPLAMVVITDGMPNDEEEALAAAEVAKKNGIDIITVGTDDADQGFLQKLASRNDLVVMVKSEQLGAGIKSAAGMLPGGPAPSQGR